MFCHTENAKSISPWSKTCEMPFGGSEKEDDISNKLDWWSVLYVEQLIDNNG